MIYKQITRTTALGMCLNFQILFSFVLSRMFIIKVMEHLGRAMAQVVSRRPLTLKAQVLARVNPCGICDGQSGTGTRFSPSSSVFPCQYHSTVALQTHIISGNA
jgi:hypothetical protein